MRTNIISTVLRNPIHTCSGAGLREDRAMGKSPCCDKVGLKKGPWTPEEDQKLLSYIDEHGHGNWRALPSRAGLQRCGKSCRLRWTNYLRPDIKRGKFTLQEEQTIIQLHAFLGNRWSAIATHLPKRTDNEIKNYWNTHLKKRLAKMGIDPVSHKPKNDALLYSDGQTKDAANLSHIAQWESARLEAEARLARHSKLHNSHSAFQTHHNSQELPQQPPSSTATTARTRCLDVLTAWQQSPWPKPSNDENGHSPTSTVTAMGGDESSATVIEFMGSGSGGEMESSLSFNPELRDHHNNGGHQVGSFIQGFTELLLSNLSDRNSPADGSGGGGCEDGGAGGGQCSEDNKSYWNSILNLVNCSPANSSLF